MELKTYMKTLDVWMEQNKDVSENVRYHEVMEYLKMNKEIEGLSDYVIHAYYRFWIRLKSKK